MLDQAKEWLAQNPDHPKAQQVQLKIQSMENQGNPQAEQWLQENPDHPKAQAVRDKLSTMQAQGASNLTGMGSDQFGKVVDEAHPAISWKDRALVKNFGTGSGLGYLKQKYPNLQIEERDGEVIMKGKNESEYRKLDPSSLELADLGDIAYDVGSGVVEGAATLAGAAGGIPGAMAAGSASGVGMEALRQKIGQALGVNKEMDMGQVAGAGAFGALSPVMFGTGKASGKILKEGAVDMLEKGLAGKAYNTATRKFAPGLASVTSGEKSKVYKDYVGNLGLMKKWNKDPDEVLRFATDAGKTFDQNLKLNIKNAGDEMGSILKQVPEDEAVIDVTNLHSDLFDKMDDMFDLDDIDEKTMYDKIARKINAKLGISEDLAEGKGKKIVGYKTKITHDDAKNIKQMFTDLASFKSLASSKAEVEYKKKIGRMGYQLLNSKVDESFNSVKGGLGDKLRAARSKYEDALALEDELKGYVYKEGKRTKKKDYSKVFNTLTSLDNKSKISLKNRMERVDSSFVKKADLIEAYTKLDAPGIFPKSGPATSTSKSIAFGGLGASAGSALGDPRLTAVGLGVGLLGLGPRAWKAYFSMGKAGEDLLRKQFEKAGQKAPANLRKYFNRQMASKGVWNAMRDREGE